jgi:hypothetical protein
MPIQADNHPAGESLTFERIWELFRETDRRMKETDERMKETAERMKETDKLIKENAKQMKETDRKIGNLSNRFGELAEHLVSPGIREKFNELGFNFTEQSMDKEIREPDNPNSYAEIDLLLENGDIVIAVEIKSKPRETDIDKHINRMEILRRSANRRKDTRKYQGAIAGAIMGQLVRDYIIQNGFYAIEQTGDTVKLTIPEGFTPREW